MSKKARKGGRPRKPGARKPSGDLKPSVDRGSEYLLAKRATVGDISDTRTSYALGILMLQKQINAKQHYAGRRYWRLYRSAAESGGANVKSCLADLVSGGGGGQPSGYEPSGGGSDLETAVRVAEYRAAHQVIACESQTILNIVESVALFDAMPAAPELDRLKRGLDLLYIHFKGEEIAADLPAGDIDETERLKAAADAFARVEADPEKKALLEKQRQARHRPQFFDRIIYSGEGGFQTINFSEPMNPEKW